MPLLLNILFIFTFSYWICWFFTFHLLIIWFISGWNLLIISLNLLACCFINNTFLPGKILWPIKTCTIFEQAMCTNYRWVALHIQHLLTSLANLAMAPINVRITLTSTFRLLFSALTYTLCTLMCFHFIPWAINSLFWFFLEIV